MLLSNAAKERVGGQYMAKASWVKSKGRFIKDRLSKILYLGLRVLRDTALTLVIVTILLLLLLFIIMTVVIFGTRYVTKKGCQTSKSMILFLISLLRSSLLIQQSRKVLMRLKHLVQTLLVQKKEKIR